MDNPLEQAISALHEAIEALSKTKQSAGGPEQARAVAIAISNAETALLWAEEARGR